MTEQEQRITIQDQEYVIIKRDTPEEIEANGNPKMAQFMREEDRAAYLLIRKPKGSLEFLATEYNTEEWGSFYNTPIKVGYPRRIS